MKSTFLSLFLLLTTLLSAQTVLNPSFKARSGSVSTITKLERSAESTKLYIHAVFRPNWWIKLNKTEYLEDVATGKKYAMIGSEGIELGKETYMPASGEMDFILLFEPLPKETKEIHWLAPNDMEGSTYNISLEETKKRDKNPLNDIKGNWLTTDAHSEWAFGFYDSLAIMNNQFYQYETIRKKGKKLSLLLKDDQGSHITLLLTPQKDGSCFIQQEKGEKRLYSRKEQTASIQKPEADFTSFFRTDTVRLQGYIDGYDPRLGLETGMIYLSNEVTREDYPTVVTIHPDGRFESKFVINHPKESNILFVHNWIPFYVEPGQTLTIYLNWEDILARNRARDQDYPIKSTRYMGPTAAISRTMNLCENIFKIDYNKLQEDQKRLSPDQFKAQEQPTLQRWNQTADSLIQTHQYSAKTTHLIRNKVKLMTGNLFFDFLMSRDYYARQDTANQALKIQETVDYYDFLRNMPLNDEGMIAANEFGTFINRFEFMRLINKKQQSPDTFPFIYSKVALLTFLKEKGIKLTPAEEKIEQEQKALAGKEVIVKASELTAQYAVMQEAVKREPKLSEEYAKLYAPKLPDSSKPEPSQAQVDSADVEDFKKEANQRVQQLEQITGAPSSLAWELAIVRRLPYELKSIKTRSVARHYLDSRKKEIQHPHLRAEAERIFQLNHGEGIADSYELPASKATDIFRKIIQSHQGKVLFIDFWATTCGPCRGGIEESAPLREQYKNHPEFQFVYITSDKDSPKNDYDKYVDKNLKGEACYRVSETEFNYLRQLFQFNGIPHYRLIEKDGKVSYEDLATYNLAPYLKKRFGNTKK